RIVLIEPFCSLGQWRLALKRKDALDDRLFRPGSDQFGRGSASEQETQRGHNDGLASAGFARDNVHGRTEKQGGLLNDSEVADAQFCEHRGRAPLAPMKFVPPDFEIRMGRTDQCDSVTASMEANYIRGCELRRFLTVARQRSTVIVGLKPNFQVK